MQISEFNSFLLWVDKNLSQKLKQKEISDLLSLIKQLVAQKQAPSTPQIQRNISNASARIKALKSFFLISISRC